LKILIKKWLKRKLFYQYICIVPTSSVQGLKTIRLECGVWGVVKWRGKTPGGDLCLAGCNESRFSYLLPSNLGLIYYLGSHIFFTSNLSLIFYIGKNLHNFKLRFNLLSRFLYRLHFKPRFNLFSRFSYLLHFKPKFNLLYRFVYLYNLKPRFNLFLGFYHRGSHNFRSWIACIIYSWLPQRIRL